MKLKSILAALLLMVAGVQTAWSQGFRVYQSDGTELQFSLKTDSIVFDNGLSGDEVFGPFTPVNMCIAKTWYTSKSATITFNLDGTTDYFSDAKYEFLPYQGTLIIYNASGAPMNIIKVHKVMKDKMLVSALGDNEFRIWATTPLPQPVEEIVLSAYSLSLSWEEVVPLTAIVLPDDADNPKVSWESSDPEVASVSDDGEVTANNYGTCVITCSALDGSGVYAECSVTYAQPKPVTGVELSDKALTLRVNETATITATVEPDDADNPEVSWDSDDESVARVSDDGVVFAVGEGSCIITCTPEDPYGSGVDAKCEVRVIPAAVPDVREYVDLALPSGTMWATCNIGANSPEIYGDYFAWGETEPKGDYSWDTYKWMTEGQADWQYINKYTIADNQKQGCWYDGDTFIGDGKRELDPEDDAATVNWGAEWQMPSREQCNELIYIDNTTQEWTTQDGMDGVLITSKRNGNSIFLPAVGSLNGESPVPEDDGIKGLYWSRSLYVNSDLGGCLLIDGNDTYSSIYTTGMGRRYGHAVRPVRTDATARNYVSRIVLSSESLDLIPNDMKVLRATVLPENADIKKVTWESSNPSVAIVSSDGVILAIANGSCTITCSATDGSGVKAECAVSVVNSRLVTDITLSETDMTMDVDQTHTLYATVQPNNATNKALKWSSNRTNVATVDQSGKVKGVSNGFCTITCTAKDGSGVKAECSVYVKELKVAAIKLNTTTLSLNPGETSTITATVLPEKATNKNLEWSSSNKSIATVDGHGKVTAVGNGNGKCTITAKANDGSGVTATCSVTVTERLVSSIQLSTNYFILGPGVSQTITATVLPENAANTNVRWMSSNSNVARVSGTAVVPGDKYSIKVTGVSRGSCTITCIACDGSGKQAICNVNVIDHDWVDLGLPSGTLWATCNIGAEKPEDYGDYFAWGDTYVAYRAYNWYYYRHCDNSDDELTKYCIYADFGKNGYIDNLTTLTPGDDVASSKWGSYYWQMPSQSQLAELTNPQYVSKSWLTRNGVHGVKFTSKTNGNFIFLPAAGYRADTPGLYGIERLLDEEEAGYYWTRELNSFDSRNANLMMIKDEVNCTSFPYEGMSRCYGMSVRAVRKK